MAQGLPVVFLLTHIYNYIIDRIDFFHFLFCASGETMKPGFLDHPHGFGDTRTQRRDGRLGSAPKGVQVEPSNIWGTSESRSNRPRIGPPAGWGRPRTIITTNDNDNINDSSPFPVPSSISSESSLT